MKTNEKPLSFMFQVPNYAWHFNFPKACFCKIVLNSLLKVLKLPSAPPVASNRSDSVVSRVWNVIIVTALHNWHSEAAPNVSGVFVDGLHNLLYNRARCRHHSQLLKWEMIGFGDVRVAHFVPFLGIQDVYHLCVACFTWRTPCYVSIARRSQVLWRSVGEICNH